MSDTDQIVGELLVSAIDDGLAAMRPVEVHVLGSDTPIRPESVERSYGFIMMTSGRTDHYVAVAHITRVDVGPPPIQVDHEVPKTVQEQVYGRS